VDEAHAGGGLAPLDIERFWADDALSRKDPFGKNIPQVPFGATCSWECVFDELGLVQDQRRYLEDSEWQLSLNRVYNDKAERIVGKRFLTETDPVRPLDPDPAVRELHHIFEMENVWNDTSQSWWLRPAAATPDGLRALLDRVDARLEDLRGFLLTERWPRERDRLVREGRALPLYRGQRGPVTFATSLLGAEYLIFLILDEPDLAARLRDTILRAMLEKARVQDEEAGYTPENAPRGFFFADDNCALLTPEMYEFFGYPILKAVFDRYSPDPGDRRFQHSDSDMGHVLPILARCNLTGVNFGPNLTVAGIRRHMPRAVIHGQLAPFTYSRNEEINMVAEFLRDFEMARETRGLVFATAGSINNGSRLTGMRLLMAAIQRYGRYGG
jgi:uroporphyrinogen decarboxylase